MTEILQNMPVYTALVIIASWLTKIQMSVYNLEKNHKKEQEEIKDALKDLHNVIEKLSDKITLLTVGQAVTDEKLRGKK